MSIGMAHVFFLLLLFLFWPYPHFPPRKGPLAPTFRIFQNEQIGCITFSTFLLMKSNHFKIHTNLFLCRNSISKMYCKLSNVDKGILVCQSKIKGENFYEGSLHEVDHRKSIW